MRALNTDDALASRVLVGCCTTQAITMFSRHKPIERQLAVANQRLEAAVAALAPKHKGGEWEEFRAANVDVLRLQRELAHAKGEPHAMPFDFPVKWSVKNTFLAE